MNIVFKDHEVRMETDADTGELRILVPVAAVRSKLAAAEKGPPVPRPNLTREDVEAEFEERLNGVNWRRWLELNSRQTKSGRRSPEKIARILGELTGLVGDYGAERVSIACDKCKEPKQANIAYIRAILKNEKRGRRHAPDEFTEQLAALNI